jgi:polyisoprenoid-binding protein YceI
MAVWQIDPSHSAVEFSVKHMMISSTKGRFSGVTGTINYDPANLAASKINVEIDATTIDTRDEKRDGHLKSADFFDVEQYPTLTFVSKSVVDKGGDEFEITGDLTIKGATREVVLKGEVQGTGASPWGTEVASFAATTSIDRKDYGLNWNVALETGGILVGDTIKIALEIEAIKQVEETESAELVGSATA